MSLVTPEIEWIAKWIGYLLPKSMLLITLGVNLRSLVLGILKADDIIFISRSAECNRFICSFSLSFLLNCFPQFAQRNSLWSECLFRKNKITTKYIVFIWQSLPWHEDFTNFKECILNLSKVGHNFPQSLHTCWYPLWKALMCFRTTL